MLQPHRGRQPSKMLQLRQLWERTPFNKAPPRTAQLGSPDQGSLMQPLQSLLLGQKQLRNGRQQAQLLCHCLISSLQAHSASTQTELRGLRLGQ